MVETTNIAINSFGDLVGWTKSEDIFPIAVHLLLDADSDKPSECFFFKEPEEAVKKKDELESIYYNNLQRVEICKVSYV